MLARLVPGLVLALLSAPAWALTIDTFEDLGPDGEVVSSRVIGGVTVDISAPGQEFVAHTYYDTDPFAFGGELEGACRCNDPLNPENVSGARFIRSLPLLGLPWTFTFSQPIEAFGLTIVDLLEQNGGAADSLTFSAYDSQGQLLDEMTRTGIQGPSGLDLDWFVSASGPLISQVTMTGLISDFSGHGIDDLVLEAALPEPASLALLATGLAALAWRLRRVDKMAAYTSTAS